MKFEKEVTSKRTIEYKLDRNLLIASTKEKGNWAVGDFDTGKGCFERHSGISDEMLSTDEIGKVYRENDGNGHESSETLLKEKALVINRKADVIDEGVISIYLSNDSRDIEADEVCVVKGRVYNASIDKCEKFKLFAMTKAGKIRRKENGNVSALRRFFKTTETGKISM